MLRLKLPTHAGVIMRKLMAMFLMLFVVVVWAGPKDDFTRGLQAYEKGDHATAVQWWQKAAEQGLSDAQTTLGFMYENGQGVPQDYKTAAKWYRRAAEQGLSAAQYHLGVMYDMGHGVLKDYDIAMEWYRRAAEQGHASAQYILGFVYENGQGVPQDYNIAMEWYRRAAEQGHKVAQDSLRSLNTKVAAFTTRKKAAADAPENSDDVAKAKAQARKYGSKCTTGDKDSCGDEWIKAARSKKDLAVGWTHKAAQEAAIARSIAHQTNRQACAKEYAEADRFYKAGGQQFNQGHYDTAIANFKKAVILLSEADCGSSARS